MFLGTSSDRIGTDAGYQAYYATVSKHSKLLRTSAYMSVNYSEWDEGVNLPFGAAVELGHGFLLRYMYDGSRSHGLLDYNLDRFGVSIIWVWMEKFGVSLYGGF